MNNGHLLNEILKNICLQKQELLLHYYKFIRTEEDTKALIIYPIINAFLLAPNEIRYELTSASSTNRMDVVLFYKKTKVILEAKKAHHCLNKKDLEQLKDYLKTEKSQLGVLTNGISWEFYLLINDEMQILKEIRLDLGLYGDDLEFFSYFIKSNFDLQYFLNYS